MPHAEVTFRGCHTLGMLLQSYAQKDAEVAFVAYKVEEAMVHLKVATCTEEVPVVMKRILGTIDSALAALTSRVTPLPTPPGLSVEAVSG
mgnify:CR=1 FL=1